MSKILKGLAGLAAGITLLGSSVIAGDLPQYRRDKPDVDITFKFSDKAKNVILNDENFAGVLRKFQYYGVNANLIEHAGSVNVRLYGFPEVVAAEMSLGSSAKLNPFLYYFAQSIFGRDNFDELILFDPKMDGFNGNEIQMERGHHDVDWGKVYADERKDEYEKAALKSSSGSTGKKTMTKLKK